VGLVALVACVATTRATPPPRYPYRPGGVVEADLFVRHTSTEELTIRVQRLRDGAAVDCDRLLESPADALGADPWAHERSWTLARGDAVPLWDRLGEAPTRACYAVRLETGGRAWILAWRHGVPPLAPMRLRLDAGEPVEDVAVRIDPAAELPRIPEGVTVLRR
jgi:hypothetical protein